MNQADQIVIGAGEVGSALSTVLNCPCIDKIGGTEKWKDAEIIHICFPYSEEFISEVYRYKKIFNPEYVIIHSTVPLGTSRKCVAMHSPIRGLHPNLEEGIRTFVKFIGGDQVSEVADVFRRAGMKVMLFDEPETTEAMKLFDTLYYGVCVEFAKEVNRFCWENNLNFTEVYRMGNITYNKGYKELNHPEFARPVLEPIMKPIGGHCVIQNAKLLKTDFSDFIDKLNNKVWPE